MSIIEIADRNPELIQILLEIWESSVKATHLFLSSDEISNIKRYVPQAFREVPHLIIIKDKKGNPAGFMGIADQKLDMLFVSSECRGQGMGKQLLQYGIEHYSIRKLAVNEQNPLAKGFYEHMGFDAYRRTELDEQGNPYPLLYMKREAPQMDSSILKYLYDAIIVSVDKRADMLTMNIERIEHLPTPIRLRFFDYTIIEDAELTGSAWHQYRLISAGAVTQRLELKVYVHSRRKATRRQFILQFKRMEIIPQ